MIIRTIRFFIGGIFWVIAVAIMDKRDLYDLTKKIYEMKKES